MCTNVKEAKWTLLPDWIKDHRMSIFHNNLKQALTANNMLGAEGEEDIQAQFINFALAPSHLGTLPHIEFTKSAVADEVDKLLLSSSKKLSGSIARGIIDWAHMFNLSGDRVTEQSLINFIKISLAAGKDPNQYIRFASGYDITPLALAMSLRHTTRANGLNIWKHSIDIMEILLKGHADPKIHIRFSGPGSFEEISLLQLAIKSQNVNAFKVLLNNGALVNNKQEYTGLRNQLNSLKMVDHENLQTYMEMESLLVAAKAKQNKNPKQSSETCYCAIC